MEHSVKSSRRGFLARTAAMLGPSVVPASALGLGATPPSDRVTLALIGCGGRGMYESRFYAESDSCQIIAVCDPREDRRTNAQQTFEKTYAKRTPSGSYRGIRAYNDFRDVLRQKDIDAVHIATSDHWHVPITIAAAKAGKDAHTEKPLGLSIEQDLAARKAIRAHRRVFQYGAERRSTPQARHALELVLNGRIGKVQAVYVISPGSFTGGSPAPVILIPKGFDYDLWLGPAPQAPFTRDRCLVDGDRNGIFHIYDYAIGFIAGWAAHPLDLLQWWADKTGHGIPVAYEGTGKIAGDGLFNCAVSWDIRGTYADGLPLRFMDHETWKRDPTIPRVQDRENAVTFAGTEGWVSISYQEVTAHPTSLLTSTIGEKEIHLERSDSHQLNFIECVKTRKDPVGAIESAVNSDIVSHLSDICIRTGGPIRWDPVAETIANNETAHKMMHRPMRSPWSLS